MKCRFFLTRLLILVLILGSVSPVICAQKWNTPKALPAVKTLQQTAVQAPIRKFLPSAAEQKRLRQALAQKKHVSILSSPQAARMSAKTAPLTEREIAALADECKIPKLKKIPPVIIKDFHSVLPPVKLPAPYPLALYPGDLARGMLLLHPKEDLQTIFSQGLLTARSAVDGKTKKRLIFMTNVPQIAHIYTCPQTPGIPVIVHISGFKKENKHIWTTSHNIPAKNIVRVSAYLRINGKNRWGQIVPLKDGSFAFYPYQLSLAQLTKLKLLQALQRPDE